MRFSLTCNLPSSVLGIVTHFDGLAPFVVMAVTNDSNSSLLSFNFLTSDSTNKYVCMYA